MAANRSRTERWHESLEQLAMRDGSIEIALAGQTSADELQNSDEGRPAKSANLIWRVRLISVGEREVVVEPPVALGQPLNLEVGAHLVAAISIGQNRWMFKSKIVGTMTKHGLHTPGQPGVPARLLRLDLPAHVERCARRNFYRVSTAELALPIVECWPLVDPTSVAPAEFANRLQVMGSAAPQPVGKEPIVLPEVGPRFNARLVNLGGGGAGLIVEKTDSAALDRARFFWLRVDLSPALRAPIAMTARLAHTHIDSMQNIYAGMAFDFAFNPVHRAFVVEQICKYVSVVGEQSMQRKSA
jgi:hypothetical protein